MLRIVEKDVTVDTSVFADGDQVGDGAQELTNVFSNRGGIVLLKSIVVIDPDNQGTALDFLFFDSEPTIAGAENAAANIDSAQLTGKFLGSVSVASSDYITLSADQIATKLLSGLPLRSAVDEKAHLTSLWFSMVTRGTPTYAGGSLSLRFGLEKL